MLFVQLLQSSVGIDDVHSLIVLVNLIPCVATVVLPWGTLLFSKLSTRDPSFFFHPRKNGGEIELELLCANISRGIVTRKHMSASYHLLLKVILGLLWCKNVCYFFFLVSLARALVWLLFHGLLALSFSLFYVICEFDRFRSYLSIISIVSCFPIALSSSF